MLIVTRREGERREGIWRRRRRREGERRGGEEMDEKTKLLRSVKSGEKEERRREGKEYGGGRGEV